MKKIGLMIIAVIMSAALLALDSLPPQLPVAGPDAKISSGAILEQVVARLKRVEQLVYPELNRRTMADAAAILNEAYALLQLLPQDMDISVSKSDSTADIGAMIDPARGGYTPSRLVPRPRPVPERYPIMTDEFNQLLQTVMDEPFRRNKLTISPLPANLTGIVQIRSFASRGFPLHQTGFRLFKHFIPDAPTAKQISYPG